MKENYDSDQAEEIETKMMYDRWIKEPGLPPVQFDFTTKALNESLDLADQYIALNGTGSPENYKDFEAFYSNLKVIFLTRLN